MNARHIGDDFTSLMYIAVTSSVFLFKLPIREGGVGAWYPIPLTLIPPPPNTDGQLRSPWMGDENCVGGGCKRSSSPLTVCAE